MSELVFTSRLLADGHLACPKGIREYLNRREGWFMASTVTLRRAENRLLAILNDLPESAVEYVIAYARSLREQILDEEDELDRLAQERFAKRCEERERTYERIGEEEALEIACDLIHQRRNSVSPISHISPQTQA